MQDNKLLRKIARHTNGTVALQCRTLHDLLYYLHILIQYDYYCLTNRLDNVNKGKLYCLSKIIKISTYTST
jgi:hypothetical protein